VVKVIFPSFVMLVSHVSSQVIQLQSCLRGKGGGGSKTKKQEFIAKWVVFMKSHLFIMAVSCSLEQGSKKKEQSPEIVQAVIISIICQT